MQTLAMLCLRSLRLHTYTWSVFPSSFSRYFHTTCTLTSSIYRPGPLLIHGIVSTLLTPGAGRIAVTAPPRTQPPHLDCSNSHLFSHTSELVSTSDSPNKEQLGHILEG